MQKFRFITLTSTTSTTTSIKTYIVLADKVDDFCEDMRANGEKGSIHINYVTLCLNGSIGRGEYIRTININ